MTTEMQGRLKQAIRDVPDFPKPGILFKDITPVLLDPVLLRGAIDSFVASCKDLKIDKIAGIDARGFLFGPAVATALGAGFVPVRKRGKLPYKTRGISYELEYGTAEVEIHVDAIEKGDRVLILDDLLATGGTAGAAAQLLREAGGELVGARFLVELAFLAGREKLAPCEVLSLVTFD
jgi:adenine phosphoribosyltransferase